MIRHANTLDDMQAVWRLAYEIYKHEGYCLENADGMLQHYPHLDCIKETTVFMLEEEGELLGTNSLTVDGPNGLHTDIDFPNETREVREQCLAEMKNLGSSWRIVTKAMAGQIRIVKQLIEATRVYGLGLGLDVVLFTFNPKHERIYQRMLGLRTIARTDYCPTVNGAPAVLMIGDKWRE